MNIWYVNIKLERIKKCFLIFDICGRLFKMSFVIIFKKYIGVRNKFIYRKGIKGNIYIIYMKYIL